MLEIISIAIEKGDCKRRTFYLKNYPVERDKIGFIKKRFQRYGEVYLTFKDLTR